MYKKAWCTCKGCCFAYKAYLKFSLPPASLDLKVPRYVVKDLNKNIEQFMVLSKATVKGLGDTVRFLTACPRGPVIFKQEKNKLLFSEFSPA